jgi:hypothetical protein
MGRGSAQKLVLMAAFGKDTRTLGIMEGSGNVTISDAALTRLVVKLTRGDLLPKAFALYQNYPNPFNPSTTIRYDLPVNSTVNLKIYDVLGRVVATLFEGTQSAGFRSLEFDGGAFPSGVYFYRLQAEHFSAFRKMLLIR